MTSPWVIPPATLRWLEAAPADRPVILLMRHSVRPPIPPGETGNELSLTEEGIHLAEQLGQVVGRRLSSIRTSPVRRCIQTATALAGGAAVPLGASADRLLGEPGVFVADPQLAWEQSWKRLEYEDLLNAVVDGKHDLAGFAVPRRAAGRLLEHMVENAAGPGVHLFVTHDSIVLPTAAHLLGLPLRRPEWPWYLDALVLWPDRGGYEVRYRVHTRRIESPREFIDDALTPDLVHEFGDQQLRSVLGEGFSGRVLLAGGCFKSLLTRKPPRELDIWAASEEDRALLVGTLHERGARALDGARPFGEAFQLGEVIVDVPRKTEPATLEDRLARFDLLLSCAGVEWSGGRTRAVLHPMASESVRRRRVVFQKPLANWKYALYSLERARRYAAELGYVLEEKEEETVWRIFEQQPPDTRQEMVDRYWRCSPGRLGVPEEISCRHR